MLTCPRCDTQRADRMKLASHLVEFHLLVPPQAVAEAKAVEKETPVESGQSEPNKGESMAGFKCPKCEREFGRPHGVTRHLNETHGVKKEVPGKPCTYCKRTDGTHTSGCKRNGATKPAKHGARVASANGASALLREKLNEELIDKRAEVRALESLLARLG